MTGLNHRIHCVSKTERMYRVTVSGNLSAFLTLDGLSKPHVMTQRIYRWGDRIATYRPTLSWDQQLSVERRVPLQTIRTGDQLYYFERIEIPTITAVPVSVDDVYDENVTMYTMHSHITMLEMKDMCILIGTAPELCKLPLCSELISCLRTIEVASDSCRLVQPPPDLMQPTSLQSSRLVETSHDPRPHQSHLQSRAGRHYPPRYVQQGAHLHRSHDRPERVQQPLPSHASHSRGSGGYVPRMQSGAHTGSTHQQIGQRPTDRAQFRPMHRTTPLSGSVQQQRRVRRPEFVPEEP